MAYEQIPYHIGDTNGMMSNHFSDTTKKVNIQLDFKNTCILASAYFLELSQHNFTDKELVEFVVIIKRAKDGIHKLLARGIN